MTSVNLAGYAEHPVLGESPYRVDRDGVSYVPVGDGGIVLGLELGDSVFKLAADHAAPGACLLHPDAAARHALAAFACIGNQVVVRTGPAAGAVGSVVGKRGEAGRVIASFRQADLALLRPSDEVLVRASGQGWRPDGLTADVTVMNLDPAILSALPVHLAADGRTVTAGVRAVLPGRLAGNGIGRPAASWDLDLQLTADDLATGGPAGSAAAGAASAGGAAAGGAAARGVAPAGPEVLLGDLIAVTDIDARYNMGYRRGWLTVGVVVHGPSPLPGHGPGITPILTGPSAALQPLPDAAGHTGLTAAAVQLQ
jgi:plasmid stability protein